jgi:asparagine synthase (glutamine-hydrolysing)
MKAKLNPRTWLKSENVSVRGHGFLGQKYIDSGTLNSLVANFTDGSELVSKLEKINGFYAVLIDTEDRVFLAADRMRTIPVFYTELDGEFVVSDDCDWILKNGPSGSRSTIEEIEYKTARLVTGSDTLYEHIRQIQAGELVVYDKRTETLSSLEYHRHTAKPQQLSDDQLKERFDAVLHDAFQRLASMADGRKIFVPLSGGYDSRLIALMLKRVGYNNVVTYSINTSEGGEVSVGRKVAAEIGYPWFSAELTHSDWREFFGSENWDAYFASAAYLGSLPILLDVLALQKLNERGVISENPIFVPGHSALDTMKATPMSFHDSEDIDLDVLTDAILSHHFKYNEQVSLPKAELRDRIVKTLNLGTDTAPSSLAEAFERWRLNERRAKLIINHIRAYDYFGYDWWLPLEDRKIYDFWTKAPARRKKDRRFYRSYIDQEYSKEVAGDSSVNESNGMSILPHSLRQSFFWDVARAVHDRWTESWLGYQYQKHTKLDREYESDPRYGIMTPKKLEQYFEGQQYIFYSLLALYVTDDLSF